MKKAPRKTRHGRMTRREFVGGALAAAGVVAGAPALLRGRNLNDKLDIAFIGGGGRGLDNIRELTMIQGGGDAPGAAGRGGSGGAGAAPLAPHPDENVVVLCDVDQVALDSAAQRFPKARKFTDLRRVFDAPSAFDAVVVSTAEHTHAFATYLALTHGKHVYCEKPLTLQHLGGAADSGNRGEVPEAVDADGQPGARLARPPQDRGDPQDGRHRPGARSPRVGRPGVGSPGCGVSGEVRPAPRLLQRHPDRRPVQGGDADPADASLRSVARARPGAAVPRACTSPAPAGIVGGISATVP